MDRAQRRRTLGDVSLSALVALLLVTLLVLHANITQQNTLPILAGDRSVAIIDLWSFQHLASGILLGSLLLWWSQTSNSLLRFTCTVLLVSLSWEVVELGLEMGLLGHRVSDWKQGYEHWGNRFVGDNTLVLLGSLVARRVEFAWKVALPASVIWLIVNILAPNSMTINRLAFGP